MKITRKDAHELLEAAIYYGMERDDDDLYDDLYEIKELGSTYVETLNFYEEMEISEPEPMSGLDGFEFTFDQKKLLDFVFIKQQVSREELMQHLEIDNVKTLAAVNAGITKKFKRLGKPVPYTVAIRYDVGKRVYKYYWK